MSRPIQRCGLGPDPETLRRSRYTDIRRLAYSPIAFVDRGDTYNVYGLKFITSIHCQRLLALGSQRIRTLQHLKYPLLATLETLVGTEVPF